MPYNGIEGCVIVPETAANTLMRIFLTMKRSVWTGGKKQGMNVGTGRGPVIFKRAVRLLAAGALLAAGPVWAQSLHQALLHGRHAHPEAPVAGGLAATQRLDLTIGLPLRNQPELDQLLQDLYDPASPNFHHYLTPQQFTERFGPTKEDYAAVTAYAVANGFTVDEPDPGRVLVTVHAPAAMVERAFHVHMRSHPHPTEAREFFAPDVEPSLDLNVPIQDIGGLDNFIVPHSAGLLVKPAAATPLMPSGQPVPLSGSGSGGEYAGKDFRAAYCPGVTLTGTGQSVGLVEFGGYLTNDISWYENTYWPGTNISIVNVLLNGETKITNNSGGEEALDIQMEIDMAPGMKSLYYYYGTSIDTMLSRIISDNAVKQVSASWEYGTSGSTDGYWQELAALGITFFNSAGDKDAYPVGTSINQCVSTPYVTSVGGTTLSTSGPGGSWTGESVWNWGGGTGTGGGISTSYAIPSWQTNISMTANHGSTTKRNIPDVALTADNVYVRYNGIGEDVGGTSVAAPLWAGFLALVNEQAANYAQPAVGALNPTVYAIGKGSAYSAAFHDITSGNNYRTNSTTNFPAVTGYDLCTGWGTPKGQATIDALSEPNTLVILPGTGFTAYGPPGGPFSVNSQNYVLTNISSTLSFNWSILSTSAWLTVSVTNGTLATDGSAAVTVSLNPATATNLAAGTYTAAVVVTNQSYAQTLTFNLVLGSFSAWTGNGKPNGNWSTATNWFPTVPAATGANLIFAGSNQPSNTNDSTVTSVGWIQLNPTVNFTDYGSTLTLNSGLTNSAMTNTWNVPTALGANVSLNVAAGTGLTLGGVVSGSYGFTSGGPGLLTLSGANTFTGLATVTNGTVNVTGNQSGATGGWSLPINSAAVTVNFQSGATVVVGGSGTIQVGSSPANGTPNTQTLNSAGTVTNNGSLLVARGGQLNLNGGTWTQTGLMTVSPPAASGYGGGMTVLGGAFNYTGTNPIVLSPSSGNGGYGTLTLGGGTFTTGQGFSNNVASSTGLAELILTNGATLALTGNIPNLFATAGSATSVQIGTGGGVISTATGTVSTLTNPIVNVSGQTGALTVSGAGTLVLSGTNACVGTNTVAAGTLQVTSVAALGTAPVSLPKGSTGSGTLQLNLSGVNTVNNPFLGFNSTTFSGSATVPDIENVAGTNTITANLIVTGTGGNGEAFKSDGGLLTLAGSLSTTITSRGLELNGAGNGVVSGGITDGPAAPFFVAKDGTGTWTLSGANTYSGTTTVSAGKLVLGTAQTGTGTISVSSGAGLGVVVAGTSQLSPGTLTFAAGTTTNEFSGLSSTTVAPVKAGTLSLGGQTVVNVIGGAYTAGQTYPLIAYTGITGAGGFTLGTLPPGVLGTLGTNGNAIVLNVTQTLYTIWKGAISTSWDIATTANWQINGTNANYLDGSQVQFDDTAGTATVHATATVSPGGITVNNSSLNYTFNGSPIAGAASLTKLGTGTLTLAGTNSYSGGTVVNAGTLLLTAPAGAGSGGIADNSLVNVNLTGGGTLANVISGSGSLQQSGSGTLTLSAVDTFTGPTTISAGTLALGGGGLLGGGNYPGAITNNGALVENSTAAQTLAGPITGTGGLSLTGSGALTLAAANAYAGNTIITTGTLYTAVSGALPATTAVNFNTAVNATLNLLGSSQTVGNLVFTNTLPSPVITITGTNGSALTVSPATLTFAPFSSGTNLTVNLAGLSSFSYTNPAGTLNVASLLGGSAGGSSGAVVVTLAGGTNTVIAANVGVGDTGGGGGPTPASILNLGQSNVLNVGTLRVGWSGSRSQGTVQFGYGLANPALVITGTAGGGSTAALDIGEHDSFEFSDHPADLLDTTAGTLTAQFGSILIGNAVPTGSSTNRGINITAGFRMGAGTLTASSLALGSINSQTLATNYTIGIAAQFSITNGGTASINTITLANNSLVPYGTLNHITNSGVVTLTNGATLNATLIQAGNSANTAAVTNQLSLGGATLGNVAGGNLTVTNVSVILAGALTDELSISAGQTGVIAAVISGAGAVDVPGAGTLTLAGVNTYAGGTTVSAGTLLVNGTAGSGAVTVNPGAILGGSGTISGAVTVSGTMAPGGAGVGQLTTGAETWNSGAAGQFGITNAAGAGGWDSLVINGALTLQGSEGNPFVINLVSLAANGAPGAAAGFTNGSAYAWTIATASGGIQNFDPTQFTVNTAAFTNAFTGGFSVTTNGNALQVVYTPAPVLSATTTYGPGGFALSFTGAAGQTFEVLATTDLTLPSADWLVLTSGVFSAGTMTFTDTAATNGQEFYQIVSP